MIKTLGRNGFPNLFRHVVHIIVYTVILIFILFQSIWITTSTAANENSIKKNENKLKKHNI